jgi:transcriptional/translational regulatory protein YebC/TACO1
LMERALEVGAEDIELNDDGSMDVITPWEQFSAVKQALEEAGLAAEGGEVTMIASTVVELDATPADTIMGLVDSLEDLDDVQNVYTNADIPEAVLAAMV